MSETRPPRAFDVVQSTLDGTVDHAARRQAARQAFHGDRAGEFATRELAHHAHGLARTAGRYVLGEDLAAAINMAICVRAPLLVTGEPGTGKTQVAYYLADLLGLDLFRFQARSTSVANDLRYEFDAVGYLRNAQDPAEQRLPKRKFLEPRALWLAYDSKLPAVLLIDEVDKAPRDFPNDLLRELDEHRFQDPIDPTAEITFQADRPPLVVATSNAERRLPDAFLRRCIAHHLTVDEAFLRRVVEARVDDFPTLGDEVRTQAIQRFVALRKLDLAHEPSTAELLTWLTVLAARGVRAADLDVNLADLPGYQALIKDHQDRDRVRQQQS